MQICISSLKTDFITLYIILYAAKYLMENQLIYNKLSNTQKHPPQF